MKVIETELSSKSKSVICTVTRSCGAEEQNPEAEACKG